MIKNLWEKIELLCMNHEEPVPMYVYTGAMTPFYACPKYMLKDEDHPDGHEPYESGCANRASFDDIRHLVELLGKEIEKEESDCSYFDFTGTKLHWKTINAVVLDYSPQSIKLGIMNTRDIGSWTDRD